MKYKWSDAKPGYPDDQVLKMILPYQTKSTSIPSVNVGSVPCVNQLNLNLRKGAVQIRAKEDREKRERLRYVEPFTVVGPVVVDFMIVLCQGRETLYSASFMYTNRGSPLLWPS